MGGHEFDLGEGQLLRDRNHSCYGTCSVAEYFGSPVLEYKQTCGQGTPLITEKMERKEKGPERVVHGLVLSIPFVHNSPEE